MPTINFYLKKAEPGTTERLVYLQMRHNGKKFVYSCRFSVDPKDWDTKKQQVKERSKTDKTGLVHLNTRLSKMKEVLSRAYNVESANGTPENHLLKPYLDEYMNQNAQKVQEKTGPTLYSLIDDLIAGNIGDKKTAATITTYRTSKKHLQAFEKKTGYRVDFDTISKDFKDRYIRYLDTVVLIQPSETNKGKIGLSQNSKAKEIKNVRTFMNLALEYKYTDNSDHKRKGFGEGQVETDSVSLSEEELALMYNHDFSGNERLEKVRDLFVFSAYVGLRYSDASDLKPSNFITMNGKPFINAVQKKTGDPVYIPCHEVVLAIREKYKDTPNGMPPVIENQTYNRYIKEVAREVGLTEVGRLYDKPEMELCDCISSHTARRSFATNYYRLGVDMKTLMDITGHKTESSFKRYIKISKKESAERMAKIMEANKSVAALRAV